MGPQVPTNMDLRGWERICTKDGKSLKGGGCIPDGCAMRHLKYCTVPTLAMLEPIYLNTVIQHNP